jgi:hypothetical protein
MTDTDLKDLLERALTGGHGPAPDDQVSPAADLTRGHRLRRRRRAIGLAGAAAVVAVSLGSWAGIAAGGGASPQARAVPPRPATSAPLPQTAVLVAYTGRQVPGYRVAYAPRGWVIQGGNAFALVIAPRGDKDKSIDSFTGKLVVMLQSRDQHGTPPGRPVSVGGKPGRFSVQGTTQILYFRLPDRRWVDIQAPTALGWNAHQLARFGSGVRVLGNAQESRG